MDAGSPSKSHWWPLSLLTKYPQSRLFETGSREIGSDAFEDVGRIQVNTWLRVFDQANWPQRNQANARGHLPEWMILPETGCTKDAPATLA